MSVAVECVVHGGSEGEVGFRIDWFGHGLSTSFIRDMEKERKRKRKRSSIEKKRERERERRCTLGILRGPIMLFLAARAELIIVLGFADQRLVPWVGIVSETKARPKVRLFHTSYRWEGLRLGNKFFKKRMVRAGVSIGLILFSLSLQKKKRKGLLPVRHVVVPPRSPQPTLIVINTPTPGSYPRKGKADGALTSHDKEVLGSLIIGILHDNIENQIDPCLT